MGDTLMFLIFWPGNYLKFYEAIKLAYPDIGIISNCDGSSRQLDHPADFYDFHVKFLMKCLYNSWFCVKFTFSFWYCNIDV